MTFICQHQSMRRQPSVSHIKNSSCCNRGQREVLAASMCATYARKVPLPSVPLKPSPNPVAWISILQASDGHTDIHLQHPASTIVGLTA